MENVQGALLLILSIGFLVLLFLSIIVTFIVVKILQNVRHITQKADLVTDNMSESLKMLGKKFGPLALSTIAAAVFKKVKNRHKA